MKSFVIRNVLIIGLVAYTNLCRVY